MLPFFFLSPQAFQSFSHGSPRGRPLPGARALLVSLIVFLFERGRGKREAKKRASISNVASKDEKKKKKKTSAEIAPLVPSFSFFARGPKRKDLVLSPLRGKNGQSARMRGLFRRREIFSCLLGLKKKSLLCFRNLFSLPLSWPLALLPQPFGFKTQRYGNKRP